MGRSGRRSAGATRDDATLVVLAHPEPRSFNAAWYRASCAAVAAAGQRPLASDLYASGFDPAERGALYPEPPARFDPLAAQDAAARADRLPPEVAVEIAKIEAAARIVFHFPLWWFGPPAMLKGWFDRCLVHGRLHDSTRRFDRGRFRGRRALFCVTAGSTAIEHGPGGREGDARLLLWPLAYALRYLGFDVVEPRVVGGVHGFHEGDARAALATRLRAVLAAQRGLIAGLDEAPLWPFNADTDFDAEGRLRASAQVLWPFIDPR